MSYTISHSDNQILFSPVLEQMPGWIFIKDLELKYTSTTLRSAVLCGFKKQQDKYGITDFELKCKASKSAEFFQKQDKKVILENREISFLQLNQYADNQVHVFLTKKMPLKNSFGKNIGICGIVEEILKAEMIKAIFQLVNIGKNKSDFSLNQNNFEIDGDFYKKFSEEESEILFYFIRGFSSREISLSMNLSKRKIESILESLTNKFHCNSRKDFYDYCLIHQIHNIIPLTLIQRCINNQIATEYVENHQLNIKVTRRQKECINLLLTGATSQEMAEKLNLSRRTIESYIDLLKSKFHARNKADLITKLCQYFPKII